jgi:FixJ family two-component response regulator
MTQTNSVVVVVDDDASIRTSLRRLLRSCGYEVQLYPSTKHLFEFGRPGCPCCLVLDVRLPDVDGLAYQQELAAAGIRLPIVFLTGCGDIPMSVRAMKAGAVEFLCKPYDPRRLLECVAAALKLDAEFVPIWNHRIEVRQRYENLSPREREVFAAVTSGLLNKQVAADLGVAEKTVKVHRARVMEKMGAVCLPDLVRMADGLSVRWMDRPLIS